MSDQRTMSAELTARVALEKYGFRKSHSLGQNFLLDESFLNGLLDEAMVWYEDNVLEIGPGAGVMTALLSERAASVHAVELDEGLKPVLAEVLAGRDNARVTYCDFMKTDLPALIKDTFDGKPWRVVANLPYYITADILTKLVTAPETPESIAIMVQKEAAERIMSSPGTKQWCALAATVQTYGTPKVLMDVPPDAFDPPPHVFSRFILIERHETPIVEPGDTGLFKVINAAFAMRRKTLSNNLKARFGLDNDRVAHVLDKAGVPQMVRGEALTLEELKRVSDALSNIQN